MKKFKANHQQLNVMLPEISEKQILAALTKAEEQNKKIDEGTKIDYDSMSERAGC